MRSTLLIVILSAGLSAAWAQKPAKSETPKPGSQAIQVPADAQVVRDGLWKHKDKDGKTWYYWKTPFGTGRGPDDPAAPPKTDAAPAPELLRVTALDGDSAAFEKPSPFGGSRWKKSSADWTDDEKQAVQRFKEKQGGKKE